jgi:thiol:disulfide interchange protein DsbC
MLFRTIIQAVLLSFLIAGTAFADEAAIKKSMKARFPEATVQSVTKTPYAGLYEVFMEGQLIYTDESGNYLFVGNVIDAKKQRNLTQERLAKLTEVKFNTLPLDLAIKTVKGDGSKRKIAVFADPDCPFCKKFESELKSVNDITVYTFLFPIEGLHSGSTEKAKAIWCAPDRSKAWEEWITQGIAPKNSGTCDNPVAKVEALAKKLYISGTPTVVFANGRRVPGAIPAAQIEEILSTVFPDQ